MKRIICVLLSALIAVSLCGCKKENASSDIEVDIEYYVKLGRIPECDYLIGTDAEEIKEYYETLQASQQAMGEEITPFDVIEGDTTVMLDCGTNAYYYRKAAADSGISYIVSYDAAFGLETGTLITQVKQNVSGLDFSESAVTREKAFFMLSDDGTALTAVSGEFTVMLIFVNDALCATALYRTAEWN